MIVFEVLGMLGRLIAIGAVIGVGLADNAVSDLLERAVLYRFRKKQDVKAQPDTSEELGEQQEQEPHTGLDESYQALEISSVRKRPEELN